jgi:hypothetical protein
MLLYWDKVSSIVPYDYIQKPEALGRYMQSLVEHELVFQVIPEMYIHEIPKFRQAFEAYLIDLGPELDRRRAQFENGSVFEVHIEKMGQIGDHLVDQRLARPGAEPWYEVEVDTANDFMSYLAAALGQVATVDSSPVTDGAEYLNRFMHAGVAQDQVIQQLQVLRIQILERVLPVPSHTIEPAKIRDFKDRHAQLLGDFRRRVERELIAVAALPNEALKQQQLDIFFEECAVRIEEIEAAMDNAKWKTIRGGFSVLAALAGGVTPLFGLAAALWNALSEGRSEVVARDFAYAAYARTEL